MENDDDGMHSTERWMAYCLNCEEPVEFHEHGGYAQHQAEDHIMETDHEVVLGQVFKHSKKKLEVTE